MRKLLYTGCMLFLVFSVSNCNGMEKMKKEKKEKKKFLWVGEDNGEGGSTTPVKVKGFSLVLNEGRKEHILLPIRRKITSGYKRKIKEEERKPLEIKIDELPRRLVSRDVDLELSELISDKQEIDDQELYEELADLIEKKNFCIGYSDNERIELCKEFFDKSYVSKKTIIELLKNKRLPIKKHKRSRLSEIILNEENIGILKEGVKDSAKFLVGAFGKFFSNKLKEQKQEIEKQKSDISAESVRANESEKREKGTKKVNYCLVILSGTLTIVTPVITVLLNRGFDFLEKVIFEGGATNSTIGS